VLPGEITQANDKAPDLGTDLNDPKKDAESVVDSMALRQLDKRWCSGMQRNSAMIAAELWAEQADVTFDEVVTARKLKTRKHKLQQMRFLLLPGSPQLNAWRATMVITVLLAVLSAPLEMAFSHSQLVSNLYWASKLIDILFWLDMFVTFNVATSSHGRMETNRRTLAQNYAKTWLVPDFLINFPWDDVLQEHGKTRKIAKILKLPKVFRVTRLLRVADEEAQFFGTAANIGGFLLMGHYLACIWVGLLVDCTAELDIQHLCPDMLTAYLQGLSVGMASLAGSDSWTRFSIEQASTTEPWSFQWHAFYTALCELVAALSCLLGVILVGMLYSNLSHAMDRHHSHTRLFHARVSNLQAAAHQHAIPKELFGRIKRHYYYVWSCGSDTSKAILTDSTLSLDLRRELAYCFYGDILKQVPFLELTDKHFLQQICEFVEIEIFAAQDRIICAGDVGTELYFVAVGEVEVVVPSSHVEERGTVIKTLHEGSFFGELGLLFPDSKHKVDVYGLTAGWLLVVPRGTLEKFCTEELLETFRFVALERLRKHSEMATGMVEPQVSRAGSDTSDCSQATQSEIWNPYAEIGEDVHSREKLSSSQQDAKSDTASAHFRRSFDLGSDTGVAGHVLDKGTIRRMLACRTEVFRKPDSYRRRHTLNNFDNLQHCEHTGVGHSRAAGPLEDAVSAATSGHETELQQTPRMLYSLHTVEHGMQKLMRRMNTMEAALAGRDGDSSAPGGTG